MQYRNLKTTIISLSLSILCALSCFNSYAEGNSLQQLLFEGAMNAAYLAEDAVANYEALIAESADEALMQDGLPNPDGYDPDDPVAMGEIDPRDVYNAQQAEEMDKAMAEEAQRAWQEQFEPQPDISDHTLKP